MNIFVLDTDPLLAAQYHVDKHIVKMPLETAQMLCTAHHLLESPFEVPYKPTHKNHPCTLWVCQETANYLWLCELGMELCIEYTYRYEKRHKCQDVIEQCHKYVPHSQVYPNLISYQDHTPFAQAMPEYFYDDDPVVAYRQYYALGKKHLHSWKKRDTPEWLREYL